MAKKEQTTWEKSRDLIIKALKTFTPSELKKIGWILLGIFAIGSMLYSSVMEDDEDDSYCPEEYEEYYEVEEDSLL